MSLPDALHHGPDPETGPESAPRADPALGPSAAPTEPFGMDHEIAPDMTHLWAARCVVCLDPITFDDAAPRLPDGRRPWRHAPELLEEEMDLDPTDEDEWREDR